MISAGSDEGTQTARKKMIAEISAVWDIADFMTLEYRNLAAMSSAQNKPELKSKKS
jgi:hypothetical protein